MLTDFRPLLFHNALFSSSGWLQTVCLSIACVHMPQLSSSGLGVCLGDSERGSPQKCNNGCLQPPPSWAVCVPRVRQTPPGPPGGGGVPAHMPCTPPEMHMRSGTPSHPRQPPWGRSERTCRMPHGLNSLWVVTTQAHAPSQSTPLVSQSTPLVSQSTPLLSQSTPLLSQSTLLLGASTLRAGAPLEYRPPTVCEF